MPDLARLQSAELTHARAQRQALRRAADEPRRVVDARLGEPAGSRAEQRLRLDADPLAFAAGAAD